MSEIELKEGPEIQETEMDTKDTKNPEIDMETGQDTKMDTEDTETGHDTKDTKHPEDQENELELDEEKIAKDAKEAREAQEILDKEQAAEDDLHVNWEEHVVLETPDGFKVRLTKRQARLSKLVMVLIREDSSPFLKDVESPGDSVLPEELKIATPTPVLPITEEPKIPTPVLPITEDLKTPTPILPITEDTKTRPDLFVPVNIPSDHLKLICDFLIHRNGVDFPTIKKPLVGSFLENTDPWSEEFYKNYNCNVADILALWQLANSANYLDVWCFMNLTCCKIGTFIRGKKAEEIKDLIPNMRKESVAKISA